MTLHDAEPSNLRVLRDSLSATDEYYRTGNRRFKDVGLLADRILDYFSIMPEDFDRLKELDEEIRHFRRITVTLKDVTELKAKIEAVREFEDPGEIKANLKAKYEHGEITLDEYTEGIERAAQMVSEEIVQYEQKKLKIMHIANHYYIPLILSGEAERISYIKHIIQESSEIEFINKLERYLKKPGNKFEDFDWWMFSKLDESLDEVYIPYYNPKSNGIARFKPDFIFWLQKGSEYFIIFIDPKGTAYTDYQYKLDGYKEIFEENNSITKKLNYEKLNTGVFTFLSTPDDNKLSKGYKKYWFDNMEKVLRCIQTSAHLIP